MFDATSMLSAMANGDAGRWLDWDSNLSWWVVVAGKAKATKMSLAEYPGSFRSAGSSRSPVLAVFLESEVGISRARGLEAYGTIQSRVWCGGCSQLPS